MGFIDLQVTRHLFLHMKDNLIYRNLAPCCLIDILQFKHIHKGVQWQILYYYIPTFQTPLKRMEYHLHIKVISMILFDVEGLIFSIYEFQWRKIFLYS